MAVLFNCYLYVYMYLITVNVLCINDPSYPCMGSFQHSMQLLRIYSADMIM